MIKSTTEIRNEFIDFFYQKDHKIIKGSSLVPNNDPTLLFTNAGMNQFKDVFLGIDKRSYLRAATSQYCVRAGGKHNDLENVGYTLRHHTFFEMLGNFSFGDYFKYKAIKFAWELLTSPQWFNLNKDKLWITVDANDEESYNIWLNEIGIKPNHIITCNNFWNMGDTGPCGPCSEIFYGHDDNIICGYPGSKEDIGDYYLEIWNLVFIQFNRKDDGTLLPLQKPSVDTGMGLERIAAVLQNVNSNYDIDIFKVLITAIANIINTKDRESKSLRVIADHIRSCAFIISEGVFPSNEGRGYVLRRIIRRAIRHGKMLGASNAFLYKLVEPLITIMGNVADQLKSQHSVVEQVLRMEEEKFSSTLNRGLTLLDNELAKLSNGDILDGKIAFRLYDTYGFPIDMTKEVCSERNFNVDENSFKDYMTVQRKCSNKNNLISTIDYNSILRINESTRFIGYEKNNHTSLVIAIFKDGKKVNLLKCEEKAIVILNETPYYGESGGQIGDSGEIKSDNCLFLVEDTKKYGKAFGHIGKIKYGKLKIGMKVSANINKNRRYRICLNHSAIHLLHAALRYVLGKQVLQKGSFVSDKYLRFDFSYCYKMSKEQIRNIENIVNKKIRNNLSINTEIMSLEEARSKGAIPLLYEKYEEEKLRVLKIGNFSIELCCGTHANRTGDIGLFIIIYESSIAAGIRRIEAVTGEFALDKVYEESDMLYKIAKLMKVEKINILDKIHALQLNISKLEKDRKLLISKYAAKESVILIRKVKYIKNIKVLVSKLNNINNKLLRYIVEDLKNRLETGIIILYSLLDNKINIIVGVTKNLIDRIRADDIILNLSKQVGCKGGGRPDLAQAGGSDIVSLSITKIYAQLYEKL